MEIRERIERHQQLKSNFAKYLINLSNDISLFSPKYKWVNSKVYLDDYDRHYYERLHIKWVANAQESEDYIATHLATIRQKYAKYAYKKVFTKAVNAVSPQDDLKPIECVYSNLNELGVFYHVDDFDKIPNDIIEQLDDDAVCELDFIVKNHLPKLKAEKKILLDEVDELLNIFLHRAIKLVDTKRSVKEIVKYINRYVDSKVWEALNRKNGIREFNVNGERYFLKMDEVTIDYDAILPSAETKLTSKQKEFVHNLDKLLKAADKDYFTFDSNKKTIDFNKRHFANLMGIKESTFKKMYARIMKNRVPK